MRSVDAPRVAHDATVQFGNGGRARSVNLSTRGILVSAETPLELGAQIRMKVNLRDGSEPLDVGGEVVRHQDEGMAVRFVDLGDPDRERIQRLVQKREPTLFGRRDVRIHLPALSAPLRASARDLSDRGVMIEAELPWLKLGSQVTTELSPERACDGRVQWIGLDVTRGGAARLRIFVDLNEDTTNEVVRPDMLANVPPPGALEASDAFIAAAKARPTRSRAFRGAFWPALAIGSLVALAGVSTALLRRPPTPTLLPTSPPERDAPVAHVPPRLMVPTQPAEVMQTPEPPPAVTTKPKHAKARPKKRTHATRQAVDRVPPKTRST
ncbi:MAG TPA: PilZ domain-containing protein [Polyangiales bacterium]|jgi:hypothetical protein|nr:PilZ domain-containing protein [Polyangiales bacterium]